MQRAGCRTVVFYQQNKGSVWLNFLNWSEPQEKNNDYYDMTLGVLLSLTIPLKTIMKLTCVGPDGLTWAKNESRSSINHEFHVVTNTNNGWGCCWFLSLLREFFSGSSGFPPSTRTNILNSNGNSGKKRYLVECPLLNSHYLLLLSYYYYYYSQRGLQNSFKLSSILFLNKRLHSFLLSRVSLWNALDEKTHHRNWKRIALLDDKKLNTKLKRGMTEQT